MRFALAMLGMAALVLAGCSSGRRCCEPATVRAPAPVVHAPTVTARPMARVVAPAPQQVGEVYLAPPAPPIPDYTTKPVGSVVTPAARPATTKTSSRVCCPPRICPPRCIKQVPC